MTSTVAPKNLYRRRCLRIGRALLEGPSAIFPPKELDEYGWLEAEFRLTIKWPRQGIYESVSVFSGGSMNRDENFLVPMIRRCRWNRSADMAHTNPWPSAAVELGHIRDHSRVDAVFVAFTVLAYRCANVLRRCGHPPLFRRDAHCIGTKEAPAGRGQPLQCAPSRPGPAKARYKSGRAPQRSQTGARQAQSTAQSVLPPAADISPHTSV